MKKAKIVLALQICVVMIIMSAIPGFSALADKNNELRFNDDGSFKILVISDTQDTDTPQKETIDMVESALNSVNADLVVFLGDNIAGNWKGVDKEKTEKAIRNIIEPVDKKGIPFAFVFGNHDHEGLTNDKFGMTEEETKEFQLSIYQQYKTCLAVEGEEMTGVGNYNLPIKSSKSDKTVFNLWFMDSNPYAEEGGYGYVQQDQTDWYIKTSNALKAENGGKAVPSLLFQHIIVPEAYQLFDEAKALTKGAQKGHSTRSDKYYVASDKIDQGELLEGPCPADIDHNQFETWKQQGDILGAFFGHDHNNDFSGVLDGIRLTAVPAAGYYSYGYNHGVRTITLNENNPESFESDIILSDQLLGYKVKPIYKARHGYYEYNYIFKPAVCGAVGGIALIGAVSAVIVKAVKKRKNK